MSGPKTSGDGREMEVQWNHVPGCGRSDNSSVITGSGAAAGVVACVGSGALSAEVVEGDTCR